MGEFRVFFMHENGSLDILVSWEVEVPSWFGR